MMALKVKSTRDFPLSFTKKDADGNTVNRTEAIAALGGAALDNEECHLYTKLMRSLGIIYIEHQARI
jgi:formate dehydrogenase major subunit